MNEVFSILKWLHVLSAAIWFGQLVLINAVILPLLPKLEQSTLKDFMSKFLPKSFKFAVHISITTVVTGILMIHHYVRSVEILTTWRWGIPIIFGATLAIILMIYNIMVLKKVSKPVIPASDGEVQAPPKPNTKAPMYGLIVLTVIFLLMMFAAHGF